MVVLITVREIIDILIMTAVLGYIFMDYIKPSRHIDLLRRVGFDWNAFKFSILIIGPGVILHELGHKFVAMAFGLVATFKMWTTGLLFGVVLKLLHSPLIILAPGYVDISGGAYISRALIAFAGPGVNVLLFGIASVVLKKKKRMTQREYTIWHITKKINLFLFIFNMIPIPPLDGSKVFYNLFKAFF